MNMALPMNTACEAVETTKKAARNWTYEVKVVEEDKAEIVSCDGNFHCCTVAIVAVSMDAQYQRDFGPFPPGMVSVKYGSAAAFEAAITNCQLVITRWRFSSRTYPRCSKTQ